MITAFRSFAHRLHVTSLWVKKKSSKLKMDITLYREVKTKDTEKG